jgi:hypothetical protein
LDAVRRWCVDESETKALLPVRVLASSVPTCTLSVVSLGDLRIYDHSA